MGLTLADKIALRELVERYARRARQMTAVVIAATTTPATATCRGSNARSPMMRMRPLLTLRSNQVKLPS